LLISRVVLSLCLRFFARCAHGAYRSSTNHTNSGSGADVLLLPP
jgi:hypothetical protein